MVRRSAIAPSKTNPRKHFDAEKLRGKEVNLEFHRLRAQNLARCEESFHACDDWSLADWACAMAGETGEACNLIKKLRRGEAIVTQRIGDELADVVIYADVLATRLGLKLGECVRDKFNEVSQRVGSARRL